MGKKRKMSVQTNLIQMENKKIKNKSSILLKTAGKRESNDLYSLTNEPMEIFEQWQKNFATLFLSLAKYRS